jgi:hypothetical protein
MKRFYFHTREDAENWVKTRQKKLRYTLCFLGDRERLYPEEIVDCFGKHNERYVITAYKHSQL